MTHPTLRSLGACALLAACTVENPKPALDACQNLAGSYDLSLAPEQYPDESTAFSLRLRQSAGACRAEITPSRYPTVSLTAEVDDVEVRLDDSQGPELPTLTVGWYWGLHFYREYHFREITLHRSVAGGFEAAQAAVEVMWAEDDICDVSESKWVGSIALDTSRPRLFVGAPSVRPPKRPSHDCFSPTGGETRPGLPEDLLPWDTLAVEASEPVVDLASELGLEVSGTGLPSQWRDAPLGESATAKDVWAWTSLPDWDSVRGKVLDVRAGPALGDAMGHPVESGPWQVDVLDVGAALSAHEFDTLSTVASFGETSVDGGVLRAHAACNSGQGGIAGRLSTHGATKVLMRLKTEPGTSLLIDVAGFDGKHFVPSSPSYDEEWRTVEIPIEAEDQVGFSLIPNSMCHWTTGATVFVDRIWSE